MIVLTPPRGMLIFICTEGVYEGILARTTLSLLLTKQKCEQERSAYPAPHSAWCPAPPALLATVTSCLHNGQQREAFSQRAMHSRW